jgi:hypothetical protein
MSLAPFHVLEDEIFISYQTFFLRDSEGPLCFLFVGDPCDWADDVGHGVRVRSTANDQYASVRLEAWTDEPPLQAGSWDDTCEFLIDWTSGTVLLDGSEARGSGQCFTFTLSSSATSNAYPTPDDYRLRIYHRYQPQFAVMFRITAQDNDASDEAREEALEEDDDFPHHMERYLFQFWPVPSTREILVDETALEADPNPRLSPFRVKAGQSLFSIRW